MAFSLLVGVISTLIALEYVLAGKAIDYYEAEREIVDSVLHKYQKTTIPRADNGEPLKVNHSLQLTHFDLDVERQILTLNAYTTHVWTDNRIKWDPSFSGLKSKIEAVFLPPEKIWRPDFSVFNSVAEPHCDVHDKALANYKGSVLYVPYMNFKTSCKVDDHVRAGDNVTCQWDVGSWIYDIHKLDAIPTYDHVILEEFENVHRDWELRSSSVTKVVKYFPCCPGTPYAYLRYSLDFKRTNHLD